MYKSGKERFEKAGIDIYFPSKIEIEEDNNKIVVFRKALMCDVKSLYNLFSEYSKAGEMLPRSMIDIYVHLRDYYIAEIETDGEKEDKGYELVGACALSIVWENLAEIRSLAVKKPYTRKKIGTELIRKCLIEANFFKIFKAQL